MSQRKGRGEARRKGYVGGDRFNDRARAEGYAARSVYKLEEVQRRAPVLREGQRVLDLGCFPGSWSQYVARLLGPRGVLVGVDLEEPAFPGTWIVGSVTDVGMEQLATALGGPADVVLSDMAPRTTGDRFGDHVRQVALARRALELALGLLAPGGAFVVKVFDGQDAHAFVQEVRPHFASTRRMKPEATRGTSVEFFVVATGRREPEAA